MKNCDRCNVRKHGEIKSSDKYVILNILLKLYSLDNMKITSSDSKDNLGRSGKGLITSMGIKSKLRQHKYKKASYVIINVSKNDLLKIIRGFENIPYEIYEKKRPKHDPTDRYFYISRQLVKCMMRVDALNSHGYPERTEMITRKHILTLHLCSTDKSELKEFPVDETLL